MTLLDKAGYRRALSVHVTEIRIPVTHVPQRRQPGTLQPSRLDAGLQCGP